MTIHQTAQWKIEFAETRLHALQMKLVAAFVGLPLIYVPYFYLLAEESAGISSGGGWDWDGPPCSGAYTAR